MNDNRIQELRDGSAAMDEALDEVVRLRDENGRIKLDLDTQCDINHDRLQEIERLREALKIRMTYYKCIECHAIIADGCPHNRDCNHYKTESALKGE